jgi:hypothetical protein
MATPLAALATVFVSVPEAKAVGEPDGRWAIRSDATRAEVMQLIRARAQVQAPSLHQCFDPLPLACQRPGHVGVGLALSSDGEVLSHWISGSTFDRSCPVTECMGNVVAGWVFEPMSHGLSLVIPIEVERNSKPLALQQRVVFVSADVTDGGLGCSDSDSGRELF